MPLLDHSAVQLIRRTRRDGLRSTAVLVGKNLPRPLYEWLIRRRVREHERFDLKYRVDTQMPVRLHELETTAPGARFANRYEGTPIAVLHKIIRRLKVDRRKFTFVDLGSGKGRVLLIAAQYPFKSVIGVEFSNKLHNIAQENIERFTALGLTRTNLVSVNCDAGEFDFSKIADKIVFCYNPFGADLMTRVLDNLLLSSCRQEETILIYLGAMPPAVSEKLIAFQIIAKGEFLTEFGFFERYSIHQIQ
jgi:SAM-dependent methyltransferase